MQGHPQWNQVPIMHLYVWTDRCCQFIYHDPFLLFQKSDNFLHWSTIVSNLFCQIYYPLEHLAWLSDTKLMSFPSDKLWKYAILCWVIYSAIQLIQSVYKLRIAYSNSREQKLQKRQAVLLRLALLQYICDLLCGLNWMGCGPLSNKLSYTSVGLLGTVSSIVQFHRLLNQ